MYVCMYVSMYILVRKYVFRVILKINIDYVPTQYAIIFLRKLKALCSLYNID
jgi:hypothetical protein